MQHLDLFAEFPQETPAPQRNCLPFDGVVNDYGVIFDRAAADEYFQILLETIPWQHDSAVIFGKKITTARQVAWYGDENFCYHYSGIAHTALPWTAELSALKQTVERHLAAVSPARFNSCLLNLYADGTHGIGWHSDGEPCLGSRPLIASLSFGASRKFAFRHRRDHGQKVEMMLTHGQLIVMRGATQQHWQHAIMKSRRISAPRINLTFRTMLSM